MFIDIESGLPSMPLVSIAKRSYKHTDRQPTYMSCSVPCLYFLRLAISTSVKALSFIPQNFATEMALQRYDFLSITFYVSLKMCTFAIKFC